MSPTIEYVAETGSTNADLTGRLANGEHLGEGHWLVTDRQMSGRGRQGRQWLDAPGNFCGSTVVHLRSHDPQALSLSFVAALAVYETIIAHLAEPRRLCLKWPNDLLLDGGKCCGILLEREGQYAVVGIGVNLVAVPDDIGRQVQRLSGYGPAPQRDVFAAALAEQFGMELLRWRTFGIEPIFSRWLSAAHPVGSALRVHNADGQPIAGTFGGLQSDGALQLKLADGSIRIVHAGDVELGGA